MPDSIQTTLKKIALFAELPDDMIEQLASKVEERTLPLGDVLFNEGEQGDSLFFILSGGIEIYHPNDGIILDRLKGGDYFGEMALMEDQPRSASARTTKDTSLLSLSRPDFKELLEKNPLLAIKIANVISARLRVFMGTDSPTAKKETALKVFISYSRRDKEFVQKVHNALINLGINTWVDWENIPLTADWWEEIRMGIENSDAFAFVISPDSLSSDVCAREINTALANNKRLIPILHREPQRGDPMHEKISSHNWVYMRNDAELQANLQQMLDVMHTDLDYVRVHTRLQERALQWERANKNPSFHLQGDELLEAEKWLEGSGAKKPQPTSAHIEFIQASRRAANQRQRNILTASFVGLGVAIILAIISFVFFLQAKSAEADADQERNIAQTAQVDAENSYRIAATAQVDAVNGQRAAEEQASIAATAQSNAEEQYTIAVTAQANAENAQAEAENQAFIARSRELVALPLSLLESKFDLSLLLGIEAYRFNPSPEAEAALFTTWQFNPFINRILRGHSDWIGSIAWPRDGKTLASAAYTTIILWDGDTGETLQTLEGHSNWINSLAWSLDGRLASGSDDGTIIIWDLETGVPDSTLTVLDGAVLDIDWSVDGRLASVGTDQIVTVWDLASGTPAISLTGHTASISAVKWSPDGQSLASGGNDSTIKVWDLSGNVFNFFTLRADDTIEDLAWSSTGALASASYQNITLWNLDTRLSDETLEGHTDWVNSLSWTEDGRFLASGSQDGTVIIWNGETKQKIRTLEGHTDLVTSVEWSSQGQLASGSADEVIILWESSGRPGSQVLRGNEERINGVAWANEENVFTASDDLTVKLWNIETGNVEYTLQSEIASASALAFSNDGRLVTGSCSNWDNEGFCDTGEIQLWDLETQEIVLQIEGQTSWISRLSWSPDGHSLASASYDGSVLVWDGDMIQPGMGQNDVENTLILQDSEWVSNFSWSSDSRYLATSTWDNTVILWNRENGNQVTLQGGYNDLNSVVWVSETELAAGAFGEVVFWDLSDLLENDFSGDVFSDTIKAHSNWIEDLELSPVGILASGSGDNTVIIWDMASRSPKITLRGHTNRVTAIAWSPDGKLVSVGNDNIAIVWEVTPEAWMKRNCERAGRNLTLEEWDTYFPGEPYRKTCEGLPPDFSDLGSTAAEQGDIERALEFYAEAESQGEDISAFAWNSLCWFGSLYNYAEAVLFACDHAVSLDPENGGIKDSRGLARALTGDYEGAIEDFEAFIAYGQEVGYSEEELAMREAWIEALSAGNNPFDEELLEMLR